MEAVVWACVNLHNYFIVCDEREQGEHRHCPVDYLDRERPSGATIDGQWMSDAADGSALSYVSRVGTNNTLESNKAVREKFAKYYTSTSAEVHWKDKVVLRGSGPDS